MAVAGMFLIRWVRKLLGQAAERPAKQGAQWPGARQTDAPGRGKLKLLRFGSDPLEVLGLEPGSSEAEIAAAYAQGMAENDPEKVEGMAEEIQTLAARRQAEITQAYRQLCGEE
jgi:DnaJ-domain-containing protein 1